MRVGVDVFAAERFYNGDSRGVLELAALADRAGVHLLTTSDHLGFTRRSHADRVRDFAFPFDLEQSWPEPLSVLSAVAAVTERIELGAYVLVATLRPAVLLAKQIATLDALSGGRTRIGMGVGWQEAEYDAAGLPFQGRFGRLEETVAACRELWESDAPSFSGRDFAFDDFHSLPRPVQSRVPVVFGLGASQRNFDRIARVADGWAVTPADLPELAESVTRLRQTFADHGRDPASAEVQVLLPTRTDAAGAPDYDAMRADAARAASGGADTVILRASALPIDSTDLPEAIDWLQALRSGLA
ncbi:TIGR03619 family F420-dependent LLM class oxidoreductase [Gordonia neofelifaecis]|uniref:Fmn dependent monooxygenase n=1 Tax=Gordonia neofelifaecis NRRL B-59395 TaxID=644548 RepID=F1YH52_9ACTN|nr:TIGR03619 family F420-dependent LLM class oxidoreductase [Gordonia neofelifaecis]EGD55967.1 fmn dependent monooxygenase [Gordonia neofelifaecis NRRL B-59395]